MPTPDPAAPAVGNVTVFGATEVGGTKDTMIAIHLDSTLRFVDAAGQSRTVSIPVDDTVALLAAIEQRGRTAAPTDNT